MIWNPHDVVIHEIAELLRAEPWFAANHVEIIEQNKGSLAEVLKKGLASLGVVCVVGVDRLSNQNTYCECEAFVTATELIPTNRSRQSFVTALDVALAAAQILDGECWHWIDTDHETPHDYVLQATSTFGGTFRRTPTDDPTKQDYENKEE